MKSRWCLLAFLALAACSDGAGERDPGFSEQAIYHGAPEAGEPWAVAVFYTRPGTTKLRLCTGSLIAPRAVLTAKHCIFDEVSPDVWQSLPASAFTAAIGDDMTSVMQQEVGVSELRTTPGVYTKADAVGGNDIAVLLLDAALQTSPKPLSALAPVAGDPLRIIGFGFTEGDVLGKKHAGDTSISDLGGGVFASAGPAWTCSGDSGGPALHAVRGEILGVSSYGPAGCNVPDSYYTRVDGHSAMIADAIAASGGGASGAGGGAGAGGGPPGCTPGPESCDGLDNDCDGVIDPGCGSPDSGTPAAPETRTAASSSGGCSVSGAASGPNTLLAALAAVALLCRRRRWRIPLLAICVGAAFACSASSSGTSPPGGAAASGGNGGTGASSGSGGINPNVDGGAGTGGWDSVTCEQAELAHDYIGCDFYPTVHPNVVKSWFDYAVVVANAGAATAHVKIERGGNIVAEGDVPPDGLTKFFLPWVPELKHYNYMCDTNIAEQPPPLDFSNRVPTGAYHLTSTVPVTVYQFNPLEYQGKGGPLGKSWAGCESCWPGCNSYTNDASLLLPSTALTGNYVVPAMSGINTDEIKSPGYVLVTGLVDGTTVNVKVGAGGQIAAGADIPAAGPGQVISFPIARGEVVRLLGTPSTDLGGTLVQADQPVQVMTGMPHTYLPHDRQSSDHLEEVVFPVETLGTRYFVARPTGPKGSAVGHIVRLFGVFDGTKLSYPSGAPSGAPTTLAAGQRVDLGVVETDFEVVGDQAFEVATFQLGQSIVDPAIFGKGDPSQSTVASVEQHRTAYVFLAPDDYDVSYADVLMPLDAELEVDGAPAGVTPTPIGNEYGIARVQLGPGESGAHRLVATAPVGLQVIGYGFATSYQYPGGLDLRGIAPPLPPIK